MIAATDRSAPSWRRAGEVAPAVLLVDDNAANLVALEAILAPLGYRTVKARSGEEALKHLLQEEFTCILLDVQMPGMDGFEAATAIKSHPRTADIPIIFVTAISREAAHVFKGYAHGAVDYLLKPFEPEVLRAKVSIFVDLRRKDAKIRAQAELLHQHELRRLQQRSEERYRDLGDSMPLPMWRIRKDGVVCTSNRASLLYTGFEADRATSLVSDDLVHPDDVDRVREQWDEHTGGVAPFDLECRLRRADGVQRWHLLRIVPERPVRGSRTTDTWIVTATDTDAQRSAFEAAESANRMKDEFLATVSHELRTPLNAILGWARMLADGMLDAKASVRAIEVIERSARTQAELINDILDVSRITSGNLRLQIAPVNLASVIKDAIEITQRAAQVKGIEVAYRCDDAGEGDAFGDPARLQQVVWNLIANAIKFTDKGGSVEVRLVRSDAVAEIRVSDTGKGITTEFLPQVFDRFRQADSSASRTSAGLGLGLAIVRHLVELHGGTVRAESEGLGLGSTFTVTLPVGAVAEPASPPRWFQSTRSTVNMLRPTRLDGMKVLFVDDQPEAREMVSRMLEASGASVMVVETAEQALEAVKSFVPDVLLSDIGLPNEDGYSLIRRVRALAPDSGGRTPAIAVTGFARAEDGKRALAAGFQMHLAKPVEPTELLAIVFNLAGSA